MAEICIAFIDEPTVRCPVCHTNIRIEIESTITDVSARITGGDTFKSEVSTSVSAEPTRVKIHHECEYKDKA